MRIEAHGAWRAAVEQNVDRGLLTHIVTIAAAVAVGVSATVAVGIAVTVRIVAAVADGVAGDERPWTNSSFSVRLWSFLDLPILDLAAPAGIDGRLRRRALNWSKIFFESSFTFFEIPVLLRPDQARCSRW